MEELKDGYICKVCGETYTDLRKAASCPHDKTSEGQYGVLPNVK